MPRYLILSLLVLTCLAAGPVYAQACSNPSGNEADRIYNHGYHTWQFCNGTSWRAFAGAGFETVSSGSGCTSPSGNEADQIYNYGYHTWQFCNGTTWESFGAAGQSPTYPNGYFVLSGGTYTGNFASYSASGGVGGRAGADAICLHELTTNTGWKGYATAKSEGLLVSGNVHALICDTSECNIFLPNTTYTFANASSATAGGASFTTDAMGYGPGDSANWSGSTYFNTSASYWTANVVESGLSAPTVNTMIQWVFADNGGSTLCEDWTSAVTTQNADVGTSNSTTDTRWSSSGIGGTACNNAENLVCFVNPTP